MPDYEKFAKAVANDGSSDAAFAALSAMAEQEVGVKMFTVTLCSKEGFRRAYSNMPDAYPTSGTKPVEENEWTQHVIVEKQTFVANEISEIEKVFPDHALLKSIGCESVINVPITLNGKVLGTINCLNEAGFYTEERVEAANALKLPSLICLLIHQARGAN